MRQLKVGCSDVLYQASTRCSLSVSLGLPFSRLPGPGKAHKQLGSSRTLPFWQTWLKLASEFTGSIRDRKTHPWHSHKRVVSLGNQAGKKEIV